MFAAIILNSCTYSNAYKKMQKRMANSVDTDQTAPEGAVWSGSSLFAQTYLPQYCNDPPRQVWANSEDPDQTFLERVCHFTLFAILSAFLDILGSSQ